MPVYVNPNPHPITIALHEPRTSLAIFPKAWARSRLPEGAKQEVELDAALARPLIQVGMLTLAPVANPSQPVTISTADTQRTTGIYEPSHQERNATLDPHPAPKLRDSTTLIEKRKRMQQAKTEPSPSTKKRRYVVD